MRFGAALGWRPDDVLDCPWAILHDLLTHLDAYERARRGWDYALAQVPTALQHADQNQEFLEAVAAATRSPLPTPETFQPVPHNEQQEAALRVQGYLDEIAREHAARQAARG